VRWRRYDGMNPFEVVKKLKISKCFVLFGQITTLADVLGVKMYLSTVWGVVSLGETNI
jgi:hypothetical protein